MPTTNKNDVVDHPSHYNKSASGVECIDVVEHMSFNLGNAVKYIWRADEKGNAIEDLKKAIWYINREIARKDQRGTDRPFTKAVAESAVNEHVGYRE